MKRLASASPEQTWQIGHVLGSTAAAGGVFALSGPLGSGKTVLAKGFASGLGVLEAVTSPSFALVVEYPGRAPFLHIDLYRIAGPSELEGLGLRELMSADKVCLIEWAERAVDYLPDDCVRIALAFNADGSRTVEIDDRRRP